jgi:RNA polymerase sigma-70 factor (ECF subfamily)
MSLRSGLGRKAREGEMTAAAILRVGSRGVAGSPSTVVPDFAALEEHRRELTGYCYRMLGSPFDAEDAVQETLVRAWRGLERFEGRAALRSWLYRIATNVCFDMLKAGQRRARPMDLGPAQEPVAENLRTLPEGVWVEPTPDPAEHAVARETIRFAFVAALQRLPARQRAALILCEVLHWQASEVAELLDASVASVNSALQRARATLAASSELASERTAPLGPAERELLERYVAAFERYDIEALVALIREDATQSMPPYDLWLAGRENILSWWLGPGIGCSGSRVIPASSANGQPAFGQYKPSPEGGYEPWALQVLELSGGAIAEFTFFLDAERLFPLFGLPPRLDG